MLACDDSPLKRPRRKCRFEEDAHPWAENLPAPWRPAALAPLYFATHREYEMPAARTVGYDEDGAACYCKHHYVLVETRSDDDEEFYQAISYAEAVEAWLLRDGRWLIHRFIQNGEEGGRGFYSFSENMPK